MTSETWVPCSERLPNENIVVETKIDDEKGCRNQAYLYRSGRVWFTPTMYVYYTPTHWRPINAE